jgi:hypothetical protein
MVEKRRGAITVNMSFGPMLRVGVESACVRDRELEVVETAERNRFKEKAESNRVIGNKFSH